MDILVIGGTRFVGRHLVEAALARGHAAGLHARSVADTLAWHRERDAATDLPGRLAAARERELLAAWHAR